MNRRRRSTAEITAAMAMLAGLGISPEAAEPAYDLLDEMQEQDEKRFLASLKGAPLDIWRRKIARGLTADELEFIRERLK